MIIKPSTRRAEIEQFDYWYSQDTLDTFPPTTAKELRAHRRGLKGEQEMAFHLDRELSTSADHAVIHDLRILDTDGTYAQFDHLVLSRNSKTISIFEVKNFSGRLSKNDHGEWMVWYEGRRRPVDVPNPVAQARRQRGSLERWLERAKLDKFFTQIGCFVVVPAKCAIDRTKISVSDPVYKTDNVLREWVQFGGISPFGKLLSTGVSSDALKKIGLSLCRCHEEPDTTIFHRLNVIPAEILEESKSNTNDEPNGATQLKQNSEAAYHINGE